MAVASWKQAGCRWQRLSNRKPKDELNSAMRSKRRMAENEKKRAPALKVVDFSSLSKCATHLWTAPRSVVSYCSPR